MASTLTDRHQVTIPKNICENLGLGPGSRIILDVDERGRIVISKDEQGGEPPLRDRFEQARGKATIKWKTDELMQLIRGDD